MGCKNVDYIRLIQDRVCEFGSGISGFSLEFYEQLSDCQILENDSAA
jgi:hypothetical protein